MTMDEQEFFRQATLSICSSLVIEKAMVSCMETLTQYLPVEKLFFNLYEYKMGAMRTIASATRMEGKRLDRITYLPESARRFMDKKRQRFDKEGPYDEVMINNTPAENPVSRAMVQDFGIEDSALLILPLMLEDIVGHAIFTAGRNHAWTTEHAKLVSMLKEPFAIALSNALQHQHVLRLKELLADDNRYLQQELQRMSGEDIIGADFGLKSVMDSVHQVAPLSSPVLLLGETGTGKEVIASAIHRASRRRNKPFIAVNCGAIPDSLMDSELFGHEKGAFTGALSQKRGRFERAHQGTIFLDEIAELSPDAQVRLLRVLQEKEIERVGGTESISVDIRVIAATHRDLQSMIEQGTFRQDLYFRLQVFPISLPPLRERRGDIPALAHYFMRKKSHEMTLGFEPQLAPDGLAQLKAYDWPGNVRELENTIERALILCKGNPLSFTDLFHPYATDKGRPSKQKKNRTLDEVVANHIREVLERTRGKVEGKEGAAERLNINPGTLRFRMRKLGIPFGRKQEL
jgi:transcriptional regulator with GAF, ATPase, and Fis domain